MSLMLSGDLAEILFRLQHDLVGAPEQIEVVDLEAAQVDLQALEDVVDRDVQGADLVAVDVQLDLRNRGAVAGVDAGELRTLGHGLHDLVFRRGQLLRRPADLVLQFEDESRGVAETVDGRRREHQRDRLRIGGELLPGCRQDGLELLLVALPLFPRFEHGDDGSVVGGVGVGQQVESARGEDFLHAGNALQIRFGAPHQLVGALHRSAVGKGEDAEEIALVFVRNETGRQLHEEAARSKPESRKAGEADHHAPQEEAHAAEIAAA